MTRYIDDIVIKNAGDRAFARWMNKVEDLVLKETKVGLLDLSDENYRTNFDDGWTSDQMGWLVVFHTNRWIDSLGD